MFHMWNTGKSKGVESDKIDTVSKAGIEAASRELLEFWREDPMDKYSFLYFLKGFISLDGLHVY